MSPRHCYTSLGKAGRLARRTDPHTTPGLLAGLLLLAVLMPGPFRALADAAESATSANRCLLIVDTSHAMQRRAEGALKTVRALLLSSLSGQLRQGDTLGVWTYNDKLYAGRFPLQTWSPSAEADITSRTLAFLKSQKYEKQANFASVLAPLGGLVKGSQRLTIILVSSGDEPMRGTPFDGRINAFYQQWREEQQKARMPFVTVFRASDGQLADVAVSTPPWPTQIPRMPQESQRAETIQSKLLEALHNPTPTASVPLGVSGKTAQVERGPGSTPKPAAAAVAVPGIAPTPADTNQSATAPASQPAAPPTQTAMLAPTAAASTAPPAEVTPNPPAEPTARAEANGKLAAGPAVESTKPAPAKSEAVPATSISLVPPRAAVVASSQPAPAGEVKVTAQPAPRLSAQPQVQPLAGLEPKPLPAAPATSQRAATRPAPEPTTGVAAAASSKSAGMSEPNATSVPAQPRVASVTATASQAAAVPAEAMARHRAVWIAGLGLLGLVCCFAVLQVRRSRATPRASLITQSFERKGKP